MTSQVIDSDTVKKLIRKLLQNRKTNITNDYFLKLQGLVGVPENRKTIIMQDIHIVLNEYYDIHINERSLASVVRIASDLAEDIKYSYPIAINGKFLPNILKYMDKVLDKKVPPSIYQSLSKAQIETPSELEMYYSYSKHYDRETVLSMAKLFHLLMKNNNTAKWVGKNSIDELGSLFVVIMLSNEDGQSQIRDQLVSGLSYLFKHESTVISINRSAYLSSWIFNNMLEICSCSYDTFIEYITWISELLHFEEAGNSSKSTTYHSLHFTRIINSVMADLCLFKELGKQAFLNFSGQIDDKKRQNLFETVAEMFLIAANNKKMRVNLVEFRMRNGFDLYFRFLGELSLRKYDLAFSKTGLALLRMLEGLEYQLPPLYRRLSLLVLSWASRSPNYMIPVLLCRVNKFFFYDSGQKKLFTDILENVLISKKPEFEYELQERLREVDKFLKERLDGMDFLLKKRRVKLKRKVPRSDSRSISRSRTRSGSYSGSRSYSRSSSGSYTGSYSRTDTESAKGNNNKPLKGEKGNTGRKRRKDQDAGGDASENSISYSSDSRSPSKSSYSDSKDNTYLYNERQKALKERDDREYRDRTLNGDNGNSRSGTLRSDGSSLKKSSISNIDPIPYQQQQSRSPSPPQKRRATIKSIKDNHSRPSTYRDSITSQKSSFDNQGIASAYKRNIDYEDTDFNLMLEKPIHKIKIKPLKEGEIPVFYYQELLRNPKSYTDTEVYPFLERGGSQFKFCEHSEGQCKFCKLFDGFYQMPYQDFSDFCIASSTGQASPELENRYSNHIEFTLTQLFYDIFLYQEKSDFINITLNSVCRLIVSKKLDMRVKTAFFLYLHHITSTEPAVVGLLLTTNMLMFMMDFMAEFMINFKLLSFKQAMSNKFEGKFDLEVKQETQIVAPTLMQGYDDERKKTVVQLNRQNTDNQLDKIINFSKKMIYKDCVWDDLLKKFNFCSVLLTPDNWTRIKQFQEDKHYTPGLYTFYFWRLHGMLHMLQTLEIMLKTLKGKLKTKFYARLGHLPLQLIEMSVLFKDYGSFYVPQAPFLVDSECWQHVNKLSFEFNGLMQNILKLLISKSNKLLSKTVRICSKNVKYLGGFLDLLTSLGSLENIMVFFSNLILVSSRMLQRDPESIDIHPEIVDKFVTNLITKIRGVLSSSQNILKNNSDSSKKQIFNERALLAIYNFGVYSIQIINLLGVEKLIDIHNKEEIKALTEAVLSFNNDIMRSLMVAHKRFNKYRGRKNVRYDENYADLAKRYYKILTLFFWWAAGQGPAECSMVLTCPLFEFYSKRLNKMSLRPQDLFSFYCVFSSASKHFKTIAEIEGKFSELSDFLRNQIEHYHDFRPKIEMIYPIIRLIAVSLKREPHEAFRFLNSIDTLSNILEEVCDLLNRPKNEGRTEDGFLGGGEFGDLSIIEDAEDHFLELSRDFLIQNNNDSFGTGEGYTRNPQGAKVGLERVPVLSALEKGLIYILSLLKKRQKMKNNIKDQFKDIQSLNSDSNPVIPKIPTTLDTLRGLQQVDQIKWEVAKHLQQDQEQFNKKYNIDPEPKPKKHVDTLQNVTLFSEGGSDMTVTRIQGRNVSYYRGNPFPKVDLNNKKQHRMADPRKDISYFTMKDSMISGSNNFSNFQTDFRSEKAMNKKKGRRSDSESLKQKTFRNTAQNMLDFRSGDGRQEILNKAYERDDLVNQMADQIRERVGSKTGFITKVDNAYQNIFNRPKFNFQQFLTF